MKITSNKTEGVINFIKCVICCVGFIICLALSCNAQSTKTVYRQTLIIKNNKPIELTTWQKITVNYLDQIYQYNSKLNKRRKVLIVFGKEGVSPTNSFQVATSLLQ